MNRVSLGCFTTALSAASTSWLLLLLLVGCTRAGFDPSMDLRGADAASVDIGAVADVGIADLSMDGPPTPRRLQCLPAQPVGTSAPARTVEPAISPSGLEIVVRTNSGFHRTLRGNEAEPFGVWEPKTGFLPSGDGIQDLEMFSHQGSVLGVVSHSSTGRPRVLQLCPLDGMPCDEIAIHFNGKALNGVVDLDGPRLNTDLEMLINVGSQTPEVAIYLARPRDSSLLIWDATVVTVPPLPDSSIDDPDQTDDGQLLVANGGVRGARSIYYSFLGPEGYAPFALLDLGPGDFTSSPQVRKLRSGPGYEIFAVRQDSDTELTLLRSACEELVAGP